MPLPHDVQRCTGYMQGKKIWCKERQTCARYLERDTGGMRTPYGFMAAFCDMKIDAKGDDKNG